MAVDIVQINLRLDGVFGVAVVGIQPSDVDFVVEVPDVAHNRLVLHRFEVLAADDVLVARCRADDIGLDNRIGHTLHFVAVHGRLKCADGVNFGHNYTATGVAQGFCGALADVAVSRDNRHFTGHHYVGGPANRVHCGLAAPVLVIKLGLGHRVVDVDRRHRQRAGLHTVVQAQHTRGGFFGQAFDAVSELWKLIQYHVGQVTAVIQNQVQWLAFLAKEQRLADAPVKFIFVHALPRVDWDAGCGNCCCSMVLSRKDIARGPGHVRAELHERLD